MKSLLTKLENPILNFLMKKEKMGIMKVVYWIMHLCRMEIYVGKV